MSKVLDADVTQFSPPSERKFPVEPAPGRNAWVATLQASCLQQSAVAITMPSAYRVPKPTVRWTAERTETGFTASDLVTGVFGFGSDLNEAIRDLAHALREHRDVLERQDELSLDLQDQLEYLRQFR
jgi:hypothetical protein